jgi:hypothetical protein
VFCFHVLEKTFDYQPEDADGHWAELVHWADIIDGARWDSAAAATDLDEPAMQVMTWIENNRDTARSHELITRLGRASLATLSRLPFVAAAVQVIQQNHASHVKIIQKRATVKGDVVLYDLVEDGISVHNKFIAYRLFPEVRYAVGITRGDGRLKVSVGYNPWSRFPCQHNVARLCESFGGGGHPVVGAITVAENDLTAARRIAATITERLSAPG